MELRPLGNTGLKLSCVGFGGSPFGSVYGSVSDEEAIDTVREAFKLGINFFDTSPYYGGTLSEKVLGKALKAMGVGVISASPLSMGLLTESGPPEWHPASAELQAACQAAAAFCKKKGKDISKLALQYSLCNKDTSTTLWE
ncbi:hypothetical protein CTI12_AA144740 [Artemisia annua]|uniref:NADP-dependent oxidoreductase domain-containing protein n=1 Tax=Artemisia annua TaxID=35608 RepID=A0A2U1PJT7_ARTAN|nr:hypothetical protein CTI12_AA144740 [Artemisia annua]